MVDATDTRERILDQASKLLAEDGLNAFSMRRLAGLLGLSATALYRHYEDKQHLVVAACAEGFQRFGTYLWRSLEAEDDWQRLRATGDQYYEFSRAEPHFYRVMFMTAGKEMSSESMPAPHQKRIDGTFEFLVDRVRAAHIVRPFCTGDARLIAASLWAHSHGFIALRMDRHFDSMSEAEFFALYRAALDAQLEGFLR